MEKALTWRILIVKQIQHNQDKQIDCIMNKGMLMKEKKKQSRLSKANQNFTIGPSLAAAHA